MKDIWGKVNLDLIEDYSSNHFLKKLELNQNKIRFEEANMMNEEGTINEEETAFT